jgi:hypothetical protein
LLQSFAFSQKLDNSLSKVAADTADSEKPGLWDEIDYFFWERPSLALWFRWSLTWGRHSSLNINSKARTGDEIRRRQHQIMITRYWYHEQMLKRRRLNKRDQTGNL